jgi:MEKHLA domain
MSLREQLTDSQPIFFSELLEKHCRLIIKSYERFLKKPLLIVDENCSVAKQVFETKVFACLSHTSDVDPIFNFANREALKLFEVSWEEMLILPSRLSAEPVNQTTREQLLEQVKKNGYIDNYSGIRISKNGRRFLIEGAVVWNLIDSQNVYHGQAAIFSNWKLI